MQNHLIAILLSLLFTGQAYGAHISDRLQAGFYAKPDSGSKPLLALPSGTPLEVLAQKEEFSRVRLADNSEGWVASDFITDEKPVREQLLELQAKNGSLTKQLQQAEKNRVDAEAEVERLKERLNRKTAGVQDTNSKDRKPNPNTSNTTDTGTADKLRTTNSHQFTLWHLSLLVTSASAAFIGGILYRNSRLAKRFGGLRI